MSSAMLKFLYRWSWSWQAIITRLGWPQEALYELPSTGVSGKSLWKESIKHAHSYPQYSCLHHFISDTSAVCFPNQREFPPRPYMGKVFQLAKDFASSLHQLQESDSLPFIGTGCVLWLNILGLMWSSVIETPVIKVEIGIDLGKWKPVWIDNFACGGSIEK